MGEGWVIVMRVEGYCPGGGFDDAIVSRCI